MSRYLNDKNFFSRHVKQFFLECLLKPFYSFREHYYQLASLMEDRGALYL